MYKMPRNAEVFPAKTSVDHLDVSTEAPNDLVLTMILKHLFALLSDSSMSNSMVTRSQMQSSSRARRRDRSSNAADGLCPTGSRVLCHGKLLLDAVCRGLAREMARR
jgi:hypothetical protein